MKQVGGRVYIGDDECEGARGFCARMVMRRKWSCGVQLLIEHRGLLHALRVTCKKVHASVTETERKGLY